MDWTHLDHKWSQKFSKNESNLFDPYKESHNQLSEAALID